MSGLSPFGPNIGNAVISAAEIPVAVWDANRQIVGTNDAFERKFGRGSGSIGISMEAVVSPDVWGNFATVLNDTAQETGCAVLELPCVVESGKRTPFVVVVVGSKSLAGGGMCFFVDAASRGTWVAHEINNSLAYAMGNLSFAIETLETVVDNSPELLVVLLALRDALEGTERVRQTMREIAPARAASGLTDPATASKPALAGTGKKERARLLVVDDEPKMGAAIGRILSPQHLVTSVCSAAEGLARLEEAPGYDLILCDVVMPEMSGLDFYRALQQKTPDLARRIVFMTGGPLSAREEQFLQGIGNERLDKPFTPTTLRAIVREALG